MILSPQFTFVLGADETRVTVHSAMVSKLSDHMNALISNGMKESQEGLVKWPDVELDVFSAMYEFALTKDYGIPQMTQARSAKNAFKNPGSSQAIALPAELDDHGLEPANTAGSSETEFMSYLNKADRKKSKSKRNPSRYWGDDDDEIQPHNPHPDSLLWTQFEKLSASYPAAKQNDVVENFNPLFDAKVYCLAHERLVESLMLCSLRHMHEELSKLKAKNRTVEEKKAVIEVAEFVYSNTEGRNGTANDRLRTLISSFVAADQPSLETHKDFWPLLGSCGELSSDLYRLMLNKT